MRIGILAAAFLLSVCFVYLKHYAASTPVGISYKDVQGREHSLAGPCKHAVIVFWTSQVSTNSERALVVLDHVRARYPERLLDVVAIYLDRGLAVDVAALADKAGHTATVAVAQTSNDDSEIAALRERFKPRRPGDDIFVVDSKAGIHVVDASDPNATAGGLESAVLSAIETSVSF